MRHSLWAQVLSLAEQEKQSRKIQQQRYAWERWARPEQLPPPGDWHVWLILAGRGFGKTRAGSETIRTWVKQGRARRIALLASTLADARDVMIEGESGLLSIYPAAERPLYEPSKRRLKWDNGAIATVYSAERYEHLRGPQFDTAWVDELAKFRKAQEAWDQLSLTLRLGDQPRVVITTTPKPIPLLKKLLTNPNVIITRGTTFDNAAHLPPSFLESLHQKFEGTQLGRQEVYAELIEGNEQALWTYETIEKMRQSQAPALLRIVVAIDPATTHHVESDETGIVVVALGQDRRGYVLEDLSGRLPPTEWARRAVAAYWRHNADRIVAEINKGGDLVERVVRSIDPHVSYKAVRATRGKITRAEPIAALYEQGRVSHIGAAFSELEKQLCTYVPGHTSSSPDRMDALVWGLTELMLGKESKGVSAWVV